METSRYFAHIGLALLAALGGLFHLIYCCLPLTGGVAVVANAAALLAAGVYGLVRWRPGAKVLVYSHLLLLAAAVLVLVLNVVGVYCTRRAGCGLQAWNRPVQERCLSKFAAEPALLQGMARIHTAIHTLLILEASMQMLLCLTVISRHLFAFLDAIKTQLNVFYVQSTVAVFLTAFGAVYTTYCSHLFFAGVAVWASLVLVATSALQNWRLRREESRRVSLMAASAADVGTAESSATPSAAAEACGARLLSWLSLTLCISLLATTAWATGCWSAYPTSGLRDLLLMNATAGSSDAALMLRCRWRRLDAVYDSCYEGLELVGFWHRRADPQLHDIARLQHAVGFCLLALGFLQLLLCLLSEYRRHHVKRQQPARVASDKT